MPVYKIVDNSSGKYLGSRAKKFTKNGTVLKNQRSVLTALNKLREKPNINWNFLEIIEFSLKEETRTSVKEFFLEYLI